MFKHINVYRCLPNGEWWRWLSSRLTEGEMEFPSEQFCWIEDASLCACDKHIHSIFQTLELCKFKNNLQGVLASVAPREAPVRSWTCSCPCAAVMTSYLLLLTKWMTRNLTPYRTWATQSPVFVADLKLGSFDVLLFFQMPQWSFKSAKLKVEFRYLSFCV